jgi:membrane protein implicated in regulation of membrane protease activity
MGQYIPVCLADFFAIKALAFLALAVVLYLYWSSFNEKLAQRRERKWLENKRRELEARPPNKPEPPPRL